MLTARAILVGLLVYALMQEGLAQGSSSVALSVPKCDQLLDASYDRLSEAERSARLTSYGGCRKSKADQLLRQQYTAARGELRKWESNAKIQAREQIREYGDTATNTMTAKHKVEREAHQREFNSLMSSLQLKSDEMSTRDYMAEREAISKERGATFKKLQELQQDEKKDLAEEIKESNTTAQEEIEELAQREKESLFRQFQEKTKHIAKWYKEIIESPFEETPNETSASGLMIDIPVIGQLSETEGTVIITRTNGMEEEGRDGAEIYLGDVITTSEDGAATISLIDDTSFSVAENARLEIDEYIYDPEQGESSGAGFSILRGVFVFTSGLIDRDGPEKYTIDTPVGSIGIRG